MTGERIDGRPGPSADLIVVSRRIYTMVDGAPGALDGGVVVEDGVIQELVRRDQLDSRRSEGARVIDVDERPVLPGFVDPHAHVEVACRAAHGTVDIRAPECRNVADIQDRLAAALPDAEATGWVVAQANLFFDRKLEERRLPTREELDHVSSTVPIAVRAGGHVTVLNSAALRKAGIDRDYVPPARSVTGRPIGRVLQLPSRADRCGQGDGQPAAVSARGSGQHHCSAPDRHPQGVHEQRGDDDRRDLRDRGRDRMHGSLGCPRRPSGPDARLPLVAWDDADRTGV